MTWLDFRKGKTRFDLAKIRIQKDLPAKYSTVKA